MASGPNRFANAIASIPRAGHRARVMPRFTKAPARVASAMTANRCSAWQTPYRTELTDDTNANGARTWR